nr:hypothetical protein [Tanacetum cinerariifolium]
MDDYHFNIDADVDWVRHTSSGQQQEHEPIHGELDVIDYEYFDSGTDEEDDGIEKIRRKRLKEIKKANESADNIVRKLFLAKNDKLRIRGKCLGRIHVFTLDGEGPSNTEEVAPKKKTTKDKGKKDVGPSDPVGTYKEGVSLDEHKCLQSREIHACTSKFLAKGIVEQIEKNHDIPIRALQDELQKKYELGVSRMKAFRAKSAALHQIKGDYNQQYSMLRDNCLELRRANPNTTIKIEVERDSYTDLQTRVFKRIYICSGPLKKGFKACERDLLGLDGAFMSGPYPCQLLNVVGLDGNNGIYPLAYAIVDRNSQQKSTDMAMEELKQFNKEAFEWLAKIPAHTWSKSYFSGRAKSDILLNNLCECSNGKIFDARDAPIITALEYIREYLMKRMVNVIDVINKTDGPLTPSATKLLEGQKEPVNETGTGTSQRSFDDDAAASRKRPSNAVNDENAPTKKKQATASSTAGRTINS